MQKLRFELTGVLPSISIDVDSKYMSGFLKQLDVAFPMPSIPAMGKFWGEAGGTLWAIWNGEDVEKKMTEFNNKIKD